MKIRRWSIRWGNPYTNPPDGQPRVLIEVDAEYRDCHEPKEISNCPFFPCPPGYALFHEVHDTRLPRRWSDDAKQRNRARRAHDRVMKKAPLFAGLEGR